jgi:hypothetical protein
MHLIDFNFRRNFPIDRSLVPNRRCLKIEWNNYLSQIRINGRIQEPTHLFSRDVFFHLTHFSLVADYLDDQIVQDLLSTLSAHCPYSLDIRKYKETAPIVLGQSMISSLILNTLRPLKGWKSMEIELEPYLDSYNICTYTLPRKCRRLDMTSILAHRQCWRKYAKKNHCVEYILFLFN